MNNETEIQYQTGSLFFHIFKSKKQSIIDIENLISFGYRISMITDNDGYASDAFNSEFLNMDSILFGEFKEATRVTVAKTEQGKFATQFITFIFND